MLDKVKVSARKKKYYIAHREELKIKHKANYEMNKEKRRAWARDYSLRNKEKIAEYQKIYHAAHPQKQREYNISRYHLSQSDFQELLKQQNNSCAICHTDQFNHRRPEIDHDHKTNRIRGILCGSCNKLLGWAKDDPEILISASIYLNQLEA